MFESNVFYDILIYNNNITVLRNYIFIELLQKQVLFKRLWRPNIKGFSGFSLKRLLGTSS